MKAMITSAALLTALLCACSAPSVETVSADQQAVLAQMHATWDRPQAPLDAGPVVVDGGWAVADWTQGRTGGRALLRREHGAWTTVLCAGDWIRGEQGLVEAGIPPAQAQALAARLASAEANVSPDRLALMSTFAGIVRMQGAGHGDHHQQSPAPPMRPHPAREE